MRFLGLLIAAVALTGCGPNFAGTYVGTLYLDIDCSDGTSGTESFAARWHLVDEGDVIIISPEAGDCGSYSAIPHGSTADIQSKACPSYQGGGYMYQPTLSSGSLAVDGDELTVGLHLSIAVSGAGVGTCTSSIEGVMTREE
jgi:hypothetical protein